MLSISFSRYFCILNWWNRSKTAGKRFSSTRRCALKKIRAEIFIFFWLKNIFKKEVEIFFRNFFDCSNFRKIGIFENSKISTFRKFRFFRKFEQSKKFQKKIATFFLKIFFNQKKIKIFDRIFLKLISWSRRIVLLRFQNDSIGLKGRNAAIKKC